MLQVFFCGCVLPPAGSLSICNSCFSISLLEVRLHVIYATKEHNSFFLFPNLPLFFLCSLSIRFLTLSFGLCVCVGKSLIYPMQHPSKYGQFPQAFTWRCLAK